MNIFDMARRGDANLLLRVEEIGRVSRILRSSNLLAILDFYKPWICPAKRHIEGRPYRGFELSGGASFVLQTPFRWHPFKALPADTGWHIVLVAGRAGSAAVDIRLIDRKTGKTVIADRQTVSERPSPIPLLKAVGQNVCDLDLELRFEASRSRVAFLAVHEVLDRRGLIELCRGRGVEVGPGPNPQIMPATGVDVTYIEQTTPEQWQTLYNVGGKLKIDQSLWNRYVQGDAYPLPVGDGSLDFIFASHLLEHLANPIGHLQHWGSKLRKGGLIAAVVPDMAGSKDYVFEPTSMSEIWEEYSAGIMEPELRHFERWASVRAPGSDVRRFMEMRRSIHVHFYTRHNIRELLEAVCEQRSFSHYKLHHVANHKDFYFVLWK